MNTLNDPRLAALLDQLHRAADAADGPLIDAITARLDASGGSLEDAAAEMLADERADYSRVYRDQVDHFLSVSPEYGHFLYLIARACNATRVIEFGTSMGISTLYLAAAIRDNGGGTLIGTELEATKAALARAHLDTAGLGDWVEIREGDALETLKRLEGEIDLVLLDGAWSLYLPVLKLIAPNLRPGAMVLAENAFDPDFLDYIQRPVNGFICQTFEINEGRGNTLAVKVA